MNRKGFFLLLLLFVVMAVSIGNFKYPVVMAKESDSSLVKTQFVKTAPVAQLPVVAPESIVAPVTALNADAASRYQFVRVTLMIAVTNPDYSNSLRKRVEDLCDLVKSAPIIKDIRIEKMEGSSNQKDFFLFE
jgi:flagellar basal body-associated protein FliL